MESKLIDPKLCNLAKISQVSKQFYIIRELFVVNADCGVVLISSIFLVMLMDFRLSFDGRHRSSDSKVGSHISFNHGFVPALMAM